MSRTSVEMPSAEATLRIILWNLDGTKEPHLYQPKRLSFVARLRRWLRLRRQSPPSRP